MDVETIKAIGEHIVVPICAAAAFIGFWYFVSRK